MKRPYYMLLGALFFFWACDQAEEESPEIDISAPVSVLQLEPTSLSRYTIATGNALAEKKIEIKSDIGGKYIIQDHPSYKRSYRLGDPVKEGLLFVEIEDKEYVNNIGLESKEMNLELAKQEYEKQKSVYDKGGVTLRELRNSELQMKQAEDDVENAKIQLEKMKVTFPISGIIVDMPHYTPNSTIQQGSPLATIMDYSRMYVDVNLPETTMTEVRKGQRVEITNYNLPNDTLAGNISEISPVIDVNTRTYLAKVRFNNPRLLIRPGMFVKILIKVDQKKDILAIPKEVIISDQRGKRVFVVEENTAEERIIQTGLENENMVEVVSGLRNNERLVIKGFETLRDKSKVKVLR